MLEKQKLSLFIFVVLITASMLAGCGSAKKAVNYDEIKLLPEVIQGNFKYNTEIVSIGDVTLTKNFIGSFFYFQKEKDLCLVNYINEENENFNKFKEGEKGIIYIIPENPEIATENEKTIFYDGVVSYIKDTGGSYQAVVVKVAGNYDKTVVHEKVKAVFKIVVHSRKNCLRIPIGAIQKYDRTETIRILKNGVESDRLITTGLTGDDYAEITSGVKAGEFIVTGFEKIS
ncbi:MAG: hypothetical protein ACYCYI_11875 [Saccharofermentanales bacterium]